MLLAPDDEGDDEVAAGVPTIPMAFEETEEGVPVWAVSGEVASG